MPSGYYYNLLVLILFIVCLLGLGEVKCMDCHIIVKLTLVINISHEEQCQDSTWYPSTRTVGFYLK